MIDVLNDSRSRMSDLARPAVAAVAAKAIQRLTEIAGRRGAASSAGHYPQFPRNTSELTIPAPVAPAPVVVYLPATDGAPPPVHVNFHGGGYVMATTELDDLLCRYLAAEAGVAVLNVNYLVAPQHPFPAPPRQAFEVVQWVAEHGAEHGWDGSRLTVGGQSAGGGLAAAAARQALEEGGPSIALQVLHYPPLDLATNARDKRSVIAKPALRSWMADIFDNAYVPDPRQRADRLVSPANPADTADLTGIAPAYVLTAEFDLLRAEGERYAERLDKAGALVERYTIPGVDHGYDNRDAEKALEVYALIARQIRHATHPAVS
jgi:acetyl esterase